MLPDLDVWRNPECSFENSLGAPVFTLYVDIFGILVDYDGVGQVEGRTARIWIDYSYHKTVASRSTVR